MQPILDAFNAWRLSHGRLTGIIVLVGHALISLATGDYMAAVASLAGAVGLHPHPEQPPAPPSSPAPAVTSPAPTAKAA